MQHFPLVKSISSILIVGLLLGEFGCYSNNVFSFPSDELPASSAIVTTLEGKYYQLTYWEVESDGKVTGIGVEFPSHSTWSLLEGGTPFKGTIPSENVTRLEAHEVDFLVETTDGTCYRVMSWTIDAKGDLVCRGSVYESRVQADESILVKPFRGTLQAVDLKPIEIESFSLPRTIVFLAGVSLGVLGILLLVFVSSYDHG